MFVKPLAPSGAAGNTNKVCIGSGKGFGDCVCWFEDPNDAQDFLDQIIANGWKIPANVTGLHIVARKKESNGYFLVGTEFGICAISARALNEAYKNGSDSVEEGFAWDKVMENLSDDEFFDLTKTARD